MGFLIQAKHAGNISRFVLGYGCHIMCLRMPDQGADTFWELYNPQNPNESPYGGTIVNSDCRAWSCAPTCFLRKFF